jgi:hypothetical protein
LKLELPDPDNRHVLAAAIRAKANVILILNTSHFPGTALAPCDIIAPSPRPFRQRSGLDLRGRPGAACGIDLAFAINLMISWRPCHMELKRTPTLCVSRGQDWQHVRPRHYAAKALATVAAVRSCETFGTILEGYAFQQPSVGQYVLLSLP